MTGVERELLAMKEDLIASLRKEIRGNQEVGLLICSMVMNYELDEVTDTFIGAYHDELVERLQTASAVPAAAVDPTLPRTHQSAIHRVK